MKNFRWGILGTGKIAHHFARDFSFTKSGELRAVASRNKDTADAFATEFDIELALQDYYSLINSDEVDVIYIAVPHVHHYELTKACILAGKAVLCEKPFAMNDYQAQELYALAQKHKVFVMEAMWTRFNPVIEQVIDWVADEEIGQLNSIQASLCFVAPTDPEHRVNNLKLGGGALLDVGIYPVFLAQLFWGKPDFVQNQAILNETDVDVLNQMLLGWDNGALASLESSIISHSPNRAVLSGSKGYIEIDTEWHKAKSCRLISKDNNERAVAFDFPGMGYQFEVDEVNRCLEEELIQSPNFTWQHSLDLVQTLDEIRQDMGVRYEQDPEIHDENIEEHHHEHHHHKH
ncbi:dehydrogenase [Marinomonas sp. SBI22]|uniref:Gfo/Idh/MocA family protein n=1 Tax=unclassified Marinomonas TaxID=196814 RepID=UPI0007AFCCB4|nr:MULTISPECIES: Gfo/Idh/MocA family oxidoreductase [unclassified Marinomonas]KZM39951.1 dehydrogenase [Marinomonas sp. SBI22]KZM41245.1 dehydrogenase [Marinomonas sp. SBI8L]